MDIIEYKRRLSRQRDKIEHAYWRNEDIDQLIATNSQFHDALLREIWQGFLPTDSRDDIGLFAVGGYGRSELHPNSDIDLMVLVRRKKRYHLKIQAFIRFIWDLNLEVGISVRTIADCRTVGRKDITVATALLERRLLWGSQRLQQKLNKVLDSPRFWPSAVFFKAKMAEQSARHKKFQNTEYNLEPNVKNSPGGMRDMQTAMWIMLRAFGTTDLSHLESLAMLTAEERDRLEAGRRFFWWVRFGLHLITGRKQDHLQFDHQRTLAERLGYQDSDEALAVEAFMHDYYRHVLSLREVNDILLQHFEETILRATEKKHIEAINDRFQINAGYIEIVDDQVFTQNPSAMLELFVIMARRRDISGVRAATIRLIRKNLVLIDENYRNNPVNTKLFLDLLKAPYTLVSQLTRMRRYGILGLFIPEFGEIIGRMQHDLFHIYTVDAHTMMVIRNLRRFHYRSSEKDFPVACMCIRAIPKIELLYIAGLYHDIGKGRGGDHSKLGGDYVSAFGVRFQLSNEDCELVRWLVENHLLMSSVAQRQDIHDPDVVMEFAQQIKSEMRLNYLYTLTVADINATNPNLWNSWRATLLRQLFTACQQTLQRGLEQSVDRMAFVQASKTRASEVLQNNGLKPERIDQIWEIADEGFFLRHTQRDLVAITTAVHEHDLQTGPLVLVREVANQVAGEGATEVFLYTYDQPDLFAASVAVLDQLSLSVQSAEIHTADTDTCFNAYIVLDESRQPLGDDRTRKQEIARKMRTELQSSTRFPDIVKRRVTRQMRQLLSPCEVRITSSEGANFSDLTIIAADQPGLLALIGRLFVQLNVSVLKAHITTLGERVEDVFRIQNADGQAISKVDEQEKLCAHLSARLDKFLDEDNPIRIEATPG